MVNEEQLRILEEECVEAWNKWRENNPDVKIDLSYSNLRGANLSYSIRRGANLKGANLRGANLSSSNFRRANFRGADLDRAELREANLREANLSSSNLRKANLRGADLRGTTFLKANLRRADLIKANLRGADFREAHLRYVHLDKADLREANLEGANLGGANLRGANLRGADLKGANLATVRLEKADLREANLSKADLVAANLREVDFRKADLTMVRAINANFNSATLTGACIDSWNISRQTNLKDVICEYIYLKRYWNLEENKFYICERRPSDPNRNFEPGEFAKLVEEYAETVDLVFTEGIDWKAFLTSFQDLRVEYGEQNVSIQAIEQKSDGAFVIRLNVPPEANKAEVESRAKESYETNLKVLESQYRVQLEARDEQIAIYRQHNTDLLDIIRLKANQPITENHFHGSVGSVDNKGTQTNIAGEIKGNQSSE